MDLEPVLRVAIEAANAAVAVHRENLGRVAREDWAEKGPADFVTRVDTEAEARALDRIARAFPDHGLLAEEQATAPAGARVAEAVSVRRSGWLWIVDPLDGTTNYLHGYPVYAASVAALRDGEPAVGVVVHGVTGETWSAVRGRGARRDGEPVSVSATTALKHALIGTGFPFKALEQLPRYLGQFDRVLRRSAGVRRAGSAALDLCHVASGYFDGFWELALAPWDVAAGVLIVREAGGIVTRIDGNPDVIGTGSVLAGNADIHAALGALLR